MPQARTRRSYILPMPWRAIRTARSSELPHAPDQRGLTAHSGFARVLHSRNAARGGARWLKSRARRPLVRAWPRARFGTASWPSTRHARGWPAPVVLEERPAEPDQAQAGAARRPRGARDSQLALNAREDASGHGLRGKPARPGTHTKVPKTDAPTPAPCHCGPACATMRGAWPTGSRQLRSPVSC